MVIGDRATVQYSKCGLTKDLYNCNKIDLDLYDMVRLIMPNILLALTYAWLHCCDGFKSLYTNHDT